jgi:hypothetical protein
MYPLKRGLCGPPIYVGFGSMIMKHPLSWSLTPLLGAAPSGMRDGGPRQPAVLTPYSFSRLSRTNGYSPEGWR